MSQLKKKRESQSVRESFQAKSNPQISDYYSFPFKHNNKIEQNSMHHSINFGFIPIEQAFIVKLYLSPMIPACCPVPEKRLRCTIWNTDEKKLIPPITLNYNAKNVVLFGEPAKNMTINFEDSILAYQFEFMMDDVFEEGLIERNEKVILVKKVTDWCVFELLFLLDFNLDSYDANFKSMINLKFAKASSQSLIADAVATYKKSLPPKAPDEQLNQQIQKDNRRVNFTQGGASERKIFKVAFKKKHEKNKKSLTSDLMIRKLSASVNAHSKLINQKLKICSSVRKVRKPIPPYLLQPAFSHKKYLLENLPTSLSSQRVKMYQLVGLRKKKK